MKLNVAIIHGIGKTEPGYAKPLIEGISRQFARHIRKILKTKVDIKDEISFQEIVWDDILGENQDKLKQIFKQEFQRRNKIAQQGAWKRFVLFLIFALLFFSLVKVWRWRIVFIALALAFSFGKKILILLRTTFAAEFVNDIIGYRNKEAYQDISRRIEDCLAKFQASQPKEHLTFISHSLGTVISSDFVYDRQKRNGELHRNLTLWNFFTLGSPLALFSLQFGPELFKSPIHLEDSRGKWLNILDADDVIAYPLKPLNEEYAKLVDADMYIEAGLLGIAHIRYWNNITVHKVIGHKLALDWLALNQKLSTEALERLYADYMKNRDSCPPFS